MTTQEHDFRATIRRLRTRQDDEHGRAAIRDFIAAVRAMPGDRERNAAFADLLRLYLLVERRAPLQ